MILRGELIGTGKIGNIIGCQGFNGEWIARKWHRHIYNPNTQPQRENRLNDCAFSKENGSLKLTVNGKFQLSTCSLPIRPFLQNFFPHSKIIRIFAAFFEFWTLS